MLNLTSLEQQLLPPGTKGLALHAPLAQQALAQQNWNLLRGDTSFPVAVLKDGALQHNLQWMKRFCESRKVVLAPHGKTTMSPQLFEMQLQNGAWGMTLATVNQSLIAHRFGVKRVLLANQLVSSSDIRAIVTLMRQDPDFEFYALTDSLEAVKRLACEVRDAGLARPLRLLVELGFPGGRTGCRSQAEAIAVARAIHASPYLHLAGIEGYEGLLVSKNREQDLIAVREFIASLLQLTKIADTEQLFETDHILLSAGGSAYFDLVGRGFEQELALSRPVTAILRSGCYVTHDHGFYHGLVEEMREREAGMQDDYLQPALEVWSMVQSRPEPDLAILTMGKRDASYDIDLPFPLYHHRPQSVASGVAQASTLPAGCKIEKMNDQHAYLRLPPHSEIQHTLKVGDLVGCGISHPCTTFDKWPLILRVNDAYDVTGAINTFF
ncbi:amino acid deaminase [Undibacterium cyanobacteriorum]|uniref:Amino acid deaminase n=1 Tax=Undibacterium cyanobacteriorum TaxID=3073561 RepID=A0ABY9RJX6_9BURK|nr:amino acid deaminase [Undibacterium sp. 20NA77.5]WMW81518.1 amino acid deaminase [Undibacterium sp. 20NA77.5]